MKIIRDKDKVTLDFEDNVIIGNGKYAIKFVGEGDFPVVVKNAVILGNRVFRTGSIKKIIRTYSCILSAIYVSIKILEMKNKLNRN